MIRFFNITDICVFYLNLEVDFKSSQFEQNQNIFTIHTFQ